MNDQPKTPPKAEGWEAELEELELRRAEAQKLGGAEAVAKHHAQGRLTIRERIAGLVDRGSFQEVGSLTGQGTLRRRQAQERDAGALRHGARRTSTAGRSRSAARTSRSAAASSWSGDRKKGGQGGFIEDLAASYRIPLVNLIDGAGGSVTSISRRGHAVFPGRAWLRALGGAAGQGAGGLRGARHRGRRPGGPRDPLALVGDGDRARARSSPPARRWSSARSARRSPRRSSAGPRSPSISPAPSTTCAESEEACFAMIRRFLSYMPQNVWELPPADSRHRSRRPLRGGAAAHRAARIAAGPTTCAS